MSERRSIEVPGLPHKNPLPNASRIGPFVASSLIFGIDPANGSMPEDLRAQCELMFGNVERVLQAAGGTTANILRMSIWLKDKSQRPLVNEFWVKMFPDPHSRPARQTFAADDFPPGALVQCEVLAILDQ